MTSTIIDPADDPERSTSGAPDPLTVVIGASRGIGRAIVEALVERRVPVCATARHPDDVERLDALLAPQGGFALRLDLTEPSSIAAAAAAVGARGAVGRLLVVGGATFDPAAAPSASKGPLPELRSEAMQTMFAVNAIGPALAAQHFLALMTEGTAMFVSSHRGSLTLTDGPGSISYAASKAALNMIVRKLALGETRGTTIFAVHPGWVRTDLGGSEAPIAVADAADSLLSLLHRAGPELDGRFVDTDGVDLPW